MKRTLLLLIFGIGIGMLGWGQYSGTGTFNKLTSLADLTDGYYVVVNSGDGFAMNNTNAGTFFAHTAVSPISGVITNPATTIVWKIETNATYGGRTIYNEASTKYVSYTGSSNGAYAVSSISGGSECWTFSYASNVFTVANVTTTARILQYNAGSPRFACYTSAQQKFLLYKMAQTIVTPTTQASNITFSNVQQNEMKVDWTNGDGAKRVVIMNTSNSFTNPADGTDPTANTVYSGSGEQVVYNNNSNTVTVTGLSASTTYWYRVYEYNGTGTNTKYLTSTATNNPNSQATTEPQPLINVNPATLSGFTYYVGNGPSSEQSFTISGSNLSANISIDAPDNYEISTGTGVLFVAADPVVLTQTGGTVNSTFIYVRLKLGLAKGDYNNEVITATSAGAAAKTVTCNGTVTGPVDLPYSENFADCGTQQWIAVSVASNKNWTCGSGYQSANGFGGDVASDDYLISPVFNMDATSYEIFSFTSWTQFSDVTHPPVSFLYTTNYTGNPSTTTWQTLTATWPAQNSLTWTSSGNMDVSGITGTSVRFAFRYISSGTASNTTSSWRIDDISVTEVPPATEPTNHPTGFGATANSQTEITTSWTEDNVGPQLASGYLIKGSSVEYASIVAPTDGVTEIDGGLVKNVAAGNTSYKFTGLTAGTDYYFKIFAYNGSGTTINYKTDGSVPQATAPTSPALNATSEVSGPAIGSQPNPLLISSLYDTDGEAVRVFDMDVYDYGSDGQPTKITQVTIKAGTNNTANWANTIQGVKLSLNGGTSFATIDTPTIGASSIVIPVTSGNLNITDANALTLSLYVYLKSSGLTDNQILEFKVDATASSHGFTADATGSTFLATFASAPVSNQILIDVEATKLIFIQQPTNVNVDAVMSPAVTVAFADANGNTDKDYNGAGFGVSLTTTGTFSGTATTAADAANGVSTFSNIKFSAIGTGVTITANDEDGWGNTSALSNGFNVVEVPQYGNLVINEVDSDTPGTDVLEFVEIYDGGIGNSELSGLVLVFYNGNDDKSYAAYDLDGYSTDANGYFVLGNIAVANFDMVLPNGALQNGQDAVALYIGDAASFPNTTPVTTSNLLDALVYDTDDADDPGLLVLLNSSQPQINENGRSNAANHSMQRLPNGSGGQRNTISYNMALPTPGAMNDFLTYTWTGTTNTSWSTSTNWSGSVVPDAGTNAIIPDVTNKPIIAGIGNCRNLEIASGSKLEIGVLGSLTVDGNLTVSGAGNTNLVIKSDASGTGSLIHNTVGVHGTVERYLSQTYHHYISSPVAAQAISTEFINTDDLLPSDQTDIDFYKWVETSNTWDNIKLSASTWDTDFDEFFVRGRGYVYANSTGDVTKNFAGALNSADTVAPVTFTSGKGNGWNLVGNPFASGVAANSNAQVANILTVINTALLDPSYTALYFWDEQPGYGGGSSADYFPVNNASGAYYVQPGQAFMVKTTASGNFTFNANMRKHGASRFYKSTESDDNTRFNLRVQGPLGDYNEALVAFVPESTNGIDQGYDAIKLKGNANIALYSKLLNGDAGDFAIQALPAITGSVIVPVSIDANKPGTYKFTAGTSDNMEDISVKLEDRLNNIITPLEGNGQYTFEVQSPVKIENRFYLHFKSFVGIEDPQEAGSGIYSSGNVLYFETEGNALMEVFNLSGQKISVQKISSAGSHTLDLNGPTGWYVVKLLTANGIKTEKIFIY